jgi:transcriptional regulator of nitric oxide reductase
MLHAVRVAMFVAIIALIHWRHVRRTAAQRAESMASVDVQQLQSFYPAAASLSETTGAHGGRDVLDASGEVLGYVVQTSPESGHIVGFSGPTNVLVAVDVDEKIIGIEILSSGDTREHVRQVVSDRAFWRTFNGLTPREAASRIDVDGVSGATLTSLAIFESIVNRLGGEAPSLRFPDPLALDDAQSLFAPAVRLEQDAQHAALWRVFDSGGVLLGTVLRTSPAADNIIGYQGPTEARVGFNPAGEVVGVSLGASYDNLPYAAYVREDEYFLSLFNAKRLDELADLSLEESDVEGVSGATMTSMAVAESLVRAAAAHRQALETAAQARATPAIHFTAHDMGAGCVIAAGLIVGFTSLRARRSARIVLLVVLFGYLGLVTGTLVSQAMLVGWAQSGVPWRSAPSLVLLTAAALLAPITTRRNIYCTHLCPHGAAQQLVKNRLPWRWRPPLWLRRGMALAPIALLAWCIVVGILALPYSLVDIEPFDAYLFRIAGWATMTIAVVGLVAAMFLPMAYCRYGCPTGALLNFLRFNARSDHWTHRDWAALACVVLALGLVWK